MSGFVALFDDDAFPVDDVLLEKMAHSLLGGEADGLHVWRSGSIGMGHALFRTTWESKHDVQPVTLGHDVWLVADARLDGRGDLWRKLPQPDDARQSETPDSALILGAYLKWGELCIDHLIGDFSFVIWDGRTRRLFGARDPFGVRLLYHAKVGATWVISNELDCIRQHPGVSNQLNEQAVLDFLLFDCNQEEDTTFFSAIGKLPPGHVFSIGPAGFVSRRYWRIPEPEFLWVKDEDYVEGFRALLEEATSDRVRTANASVWLSGGLDSVSMTAAALDGARKRRRPLVAKGITTVYDRLLPDSERHFAGMAAAALGVPIEFIGVDDVPLFEEWQLVKNRTAEPRAGGLAGIRRRIYLSAAKLGRVVMYGEGADEILPTWSVAKLRSHVRPAELWRCIVGNVREHGVLPPLGTGLRTEWWKRAPKRRNCAGALPAWLSPDFGARRELSDRLKYVRQNSRPQGRCASRFIAPSWASILEECADEGKRRHVEVVLPYLDVRLVAFALQVPPFPWALNKYLLRRMGEGRLPREILERPKTGVGDPYRVRLPDMEAWRKLESRLPWLQQMDHFVSLSKLRELYAPASQGAVPIWELLRPLGLAVWMENGAR